MQDDVNRFIHYIQYIDPKSEATVMAYSSDLNLYMAFLKTLEIQTWSALQYDHLSQFVAHLGETHQFASIQRVIVTTRQLHNFLVLMGICDFNPTEFLTIKSKGKRIPKTASQRDIRHLFSDDGSDKQTYQTTLLMIMYLCGLRVSECTSLTFSQVYLKERWLRIVGKRGKERMVPMSEQMSAALNYYIETIRPKWVVKRIDTVFIDPKGNPTKRQNIHNMIKLRCEKQSIEPALSAHTLRHSFASGILDEGVDLRVIQELLGHSDIATTQIYTHVNQKSLKRDYDAFFKADFNNKGGFGDHEI